MCIDLQNKPKISDFESNNARMELENQRNMETQHNEDLKIKKLTGGSLTECRPLFSPDNRYGVCEF